MYFKELKQVTSNTGFIVDETYSPVYFGELDVLHVPAYLDVFPVLDVCAIKETRNVNGLFKELGYSKKAIKEMKLAHGKSYILISLEFGNYDCDYWGGDSFRKQERTYNQDDEIEEGFRW